MILGIGVDIVKIDRLKKSVDKWGRDFLDRVFAPLEISYAYRKKNPYPSLAGRFACKEAVIKSFSSGFRGLVFRDIVVASDPTGRPAVELCGQLGALAEARNVRKIYVSISHEKEYAIAQAILWGKE